MSNTLITTASSAYGAGIPTQHKLFRVQNGPHAGQLFALFSRTPSVIAYAVADPPYTNWSAPIDIITDAADYPVAGCIDTNDCIFVVYTKQTSYDLAVVKLTYGGGSWSVGTVYTIYNGQDNYYPTIYKDVYQTLYVAWSRYTGSAYTINAKTSDDEGQTWGTGPADPGTQLSAEGSSACATLVYRPTDVYCIYTLGGTKLAQRRKDIYAAVWESEETIYTGSGLYDDFSAAVSADNRLAVAFSTSTHLYYKEHDGASWSGLYIVEATPALAPQIRFLGSTPHVLYGRNTGTNQNQWCSSSLGESGFSSPQGIFAGYGPFAAVYCYRAGAASPFYSRTTEAANTTAADVFHPDSGKLFAAIGDGIYLGLDDRFCRVSAVLSTVGAGGAVAWSYWNGSAWEAFTPASGAYHFDASPKSAALWNDIQSTPAKWQKTTINTRFLYWVRATVTGAYTTSPVGSQITAVANIDHGVSCRG